MAEPIHSAYASILVDYAWLTVVLFPAEAEPQPEVTEGPTTDETVIQPKELSTEPSEEQEQEQEVSVETAVVPPSTESQNGVDVAAVEEEAESDHTLSSEPKSSSIPAGTE